MADVFKIRANEAEGFVFVSLFQLVDSFDGLFIQDVAADTINGIGWIYDDTAFCQNIHCLLDESTLGIEGIYFNQHVFATLSVCEFKSFRAFINKQVFIVLGWPVAPLSRPKVPDSRDRA